jgi:predicted metalloprotease with PDZ domain
MRPRLALLPALALALVAARQADEPRLEVSFLVDVTAPESERVPVSMTVTGAPGGEVDVAMPAWAPGAYRIVKYAKAVKNVRASAGKGIDVEVVPVDDQTWKVRTGAARAFTVSYELAVERSRMDKDHCYLAGPDTYLYVVGRKEAPCSVRFRLPEGWRVGTGLEKKGDAYVARDYDTFIDCPTELGKFELLEFTEDKALYQLVIHAAGPVDGAKLVEMCRKIVKDQNRMFGGPPFERYVFLYHFRGGPGGGGLEHLNSTNISLQYTAVRAEPLLAASVTSHEYFHLWNVKRIRPFELGPFDYTKAVPCKALWLCEGVTSYFGDRTLARCGIWSEEKYLAHLADEIEIQQNNPDRKVTSVEKASQVIWTRTDWPRVDYYNKGELLGLLIDLRIRTASGGEKSLDDVMRHLYDTYVVRPSKEGKGPIGVGFPEDGILKALHEVTGSDWKDFFARHVAGVEDLPYEEVLGAAGLAVSLRTLPVPDLGLSMRGTIVMTVAAGGDAARAGVKPFDRIAAVNGIDVTRSNLSQEVSKLKPGGEARLRLLRGEQEVEATVKVGSRDKTSCALSRSASATPLQKRLLDAWLAKKVTF